MELKCVENDEEPVSKSKEQFLQLSCFISQDLRYMHSGLKNVSAGLMIRQLNNISNLLFSRKCKSK